MSNGWIRSSEATPCPTCWRTKDGDCRVSSDGEAVVCHHPKDLRPGDVVNGWAFTGNTSDGRGGHFIRDKSRTDRSPSRVATTRQARAANPPAALASITEEINLARLPVPPDEPPKHLKHGQRIGYGEDPEKWVQFGIKDGKKLFIPRHIDADGKAQKGAGKDPWPLWKEADAIAHGRGHWIVEAEGEKCAHWLQAGGLVAVSQPGHAHRPEQIAPRYQRLQAAGVLGVVYLADNDERGRERAGQSATAAAAVGLPFLMVEAGDVWPGLPAGGSIDNATGTAAERVAVLEAAIPGALQRQQQEQAEGSRQGAKDPTYTELVAEALRAVRQGDDDAEMVARAEIMCRFKRPDSAITQAMFKLLTEQESGAITAPSYRCVNLNQVDPIEWQVEGFVPANDLTLLYGEAGAGKTTAALALAFAVIDGTAFLDRESTASPGRVLFIASDSGASPLLTALHSIGLADHPAVTHGDGQRFFVWAHDAGQGALAWDASLRGCLALLEFVRQNKIDMVVIDSCKAVTAKADLIYADNKQIAALLTFIKEVICGHCSVVLLNHDGTARGQAAGAKAWKEIPSAVHCIETVLESNEQIPGEQRGGIKSRDLRRWVVKKCRVPGVAREFRFFLDHDAGRLEPCPEVERVADCRAAITEVLSQALVNGEQTLARGEIVRRCWAQWSYSRKSVDNSLSRMAAAKHPEVVRASQRGHYRLAPRIAQALSLNTSPLQGKEQGKKPVIERGLVSSLQVPEGTQRELSEFPRENQGNSAEPCQAEGSAPVPSRGVDMGLRNGSVPTRPGTTAEWAQQALDALGLSPSFAVIGQVKRHLDQLPDPPGCTRSAIIAAIQDLQRDDSDDQLDLVALA